MFDEDEWYWNDTSRCDDDEKIYIWDNELGLWAEMSDINNSLYSLSHEPIETQIECEAWEKAMQKPFIQCLYKLHEFFILKPLNIIINRIAKKIEAKDYYVLPRKKHKTRR